MCNRPKPAQPATFGCGPAALCVVSDLVAEVRAAILTRRLVGRGERIVVAVSGGLDSMVLLRLLDELASDFGWSLIVAHLNHGLRGRDADRDEALVRDSACRLGWPCVVGWADRALRERPPGISIEMAARQARHRFLAEVAVQSGSSKVALGQHGDDQIETVLLRLVRGAGGARWRLSLSRWDVLGSVAGVGRAWASGGCRTPARADGGGDRRRCPAG